MRKIYSLLLAIFALPAMASYSGSIQGSPTFGAAKFSNGLTHTTDNDRVDLPSGAFSSNSDMAIEAWVKNTDSGRAEAAVSIGSGGFENSQVWIGQDSSGKAACVIFIPFGTGNFYSESPQSSTTTINDGAWHHLELDFIGGTTAKLFVDGTVALTLTGSMSHGGPTATSGAIGRHAYTSGYSWGGSIDEVVSWSASRHSSNFTAPTGAYTGSETNQIAIYHLQADGTDSHSAAPTTSTIDPSNAAILYSPFNWNIASGYARSLNAGAYFRVLFTGTSVALAFDTSMDATPYPELWARVDNQGWGQISLGSGSPTLSVASGLASRTHLLEVIVKSTTLTQARWTSPAAMVSLTGIVIDAAATVSAPTRRTKNVLIDGDSITEAYRSIGNVTPDVDGSDVLGGYAYALCTALDAEVGIVGFSGTGVTVSGNGSVPALTSTYNYIYSGVSRSFTSPAPDLVIFNEGTNDSGSITSGLTTVINGIKALAPSAKFLVLVPFNGTHSSEVSAVATATGATAVSTTGWFNTADSVDGVHPYGYSGYSLIGPKLMPYVNALLYPSTGGVKSNNFY